MSTVSVIIPNYNRETLIAETLCCFFNQTRPPDEIIVVDDGSTDNSIEVIKQFAPRVTLLTQPNCGPGAARNRGMSVAKGDFIQFFDSDDLCGRNKIEVQLAALKRSGADIAYGPWVKAKLMSGLACCAPLVGQQEAISNSHSALSHFIKGWITLFPACLARRSIVQKVGGFDARFIIAEDCELLFRLLLEGIKLVHTPSSLLVIRQHSENQISGSALGNARRARYWAEYKGAICKRLHEEKGHSSAYERLLWRIETAESNREAAALDPGWPRRRSFLPERFLGFIEMERRRVRRKLRGIQLEPMYGESAMTEDQREQILELGYRVSSASTVPS